MVSQFVACFRTGAAVVWATTFTETVTADNGDGRGSEAQSVYLSSKFISATAALPTDLFSGAMNAKAKTKAQAQAMPLEAGEGLLDESTINRRGGGSAKEAGSGSGGGSGSYVLRFLVMPATSQTFHLSDAFFNRFPALNV
jgi:hypothetical protein